MEPTLYITFKTNRTLKRSQWKFLYREARIMYRERCKEIQKALTHMLLYWTTQIWWKENETDTPLHIFQSAHIVTQSVLTQALKLFSEKTTEWSTYADFAGLMSDVIKEPTSHWEPWQIQSYENFERNVMNSSIRYGGPEKCLDLKHTDGSLINSDLALMKLISECSMKNTVGNR